MKTKTAIKGDDPRAASLPQISDDQGAQVPVGGVPRGGKEIEPPTPADSFAEEGKLVAQIETRAEELDQKALEVVEKELKDVRAGYPQPKIPPDVEDAGVVNPQEEADKVVKEGSTLDLPISEDEYKKGSSQSAKGRWYSQEKEVVGVNSLVALALWVKRLIGRAHKKAMKIVFRKGGKEG